MTGRCPSSLADFAPGSDHVAKARLSLFDESIDATPALLHLDEAIFCLKRLLAHGRASNFNGAKLRSA